MAFRYLGQEEPKEKKYRFIGESEKPEFHQSREESVRHAGAKGLVKGLSDLSNLFGGEDTETDVLRDVYGATPEQLYSLKGQRHQMGEEAIEKQLPSRGDAAEQVVERAFRMAPGVAAGPGGVASKIGQAGLGAVAGHLAKESEWGPWGEAAAEIVGSGFGGANWGRLAPRAGSRTEQLVNVARRHGLSEREIAPAIQSPGKIGFLSRFAHRGRGTTGRIEGSRRALGRAYENLETSPQGQALFNPQQRTDLLNDLSGELNTLPRAVRDVIERDAMDMLRSPPNAASLMDFYRDVNYYIGRNERRLGGVRQVLENHLTNVFGEDFTAINELFGNVRRLGINVRPDLASHFHDFRSAANLSESILSGNKKGIIRAVAEIASRIAASKALVSPYLQNTSNKLWQSALRGSPESAKKILTLLLNPPKESPSKNESVNNSKNDSSDNSK